MSAHRPDLSGGQRLPQDGVGTHAQGGRPLHHGGDGLARRHAQGSGNGRGEEDRGRRVCGGRPQARHLGLPGEHGSERVGVSARGGRERGGHGRAGEDRSEDGRISRRCGKTHHSEVQRELQSHCDPGPHGGSDVGPDVRLRGQHPARSAFHHPRGGQRGIARGSQAGGARAAPAGRPGSCGAHLAFRGEGPAGGGQLPSFGAFAGAGHGVRRAIRRRISEGGRARRPPGGGKRRSPAVHPGSGCRTDGHGGAAAGGLPGRGSGHRYPGGEKSGRQHGGSGEQRPEGRGTAEPQFSRRFEAHLGPRRRKLHPGVGGQHGGQHLAGSAPHRRHPFFLPL
ncbi:MAG: hypothetical protein BWY88_00115 [Synergistetes bacterium ADurb.Bin520]|nr:MAG: hypothetical protein BWY88_00115 [Synergistetes bacterium ADurb.Bin520]